MGAACVRIQTVKERASTDRLLGSHAALAVWMALWRVLEASPALQGAGGLPFASTSLGRGLAFTALLLSVLAMGVIARESLPRWRNWRVWLLALLLIGALWRRERVELLDLVYAGVAIALAVWWFTHERRLARA